MKASIILPVSLTGLFGTEEEERDNEDSKIEEENINGFHNECEVIHVEIGGHRLSIRQMVWHQANANIIWPGTYNLVDHIMKITNNNQEEGNLRYRTGNILELGAATGALSIALTKSNEFDLITRYS